MRKGTYRAPNLSEETPLAVSDGDGHQQVPGDRFGRGEGGSMRPTASQTTALLRMATHLARDATRRDRRAERSGASTRTLRQVAFFAALNSLRSFDPARGIPYRTWARSHVTAALQSYVRDQPAAHLSGQQTRTPMNGTRTSKDLISRVVTPQHVNRDSGLPIDLVHGLFDAHQKGFVLFFPRRKRLSPGRRPQVSRMSG